MPTQGDFPAEHKLEAFNIYYQQPSLDTFQALVPTPSVTNRSDAFFHCASDISQGGSTLASSITGNDTSNWNLHGLGCWEPAASADMEQELNEMAWECRDIPQHPASIDNFRDHENGALLECDGWEFQMDRFWCSNDLLGGMDSTSNNQTLENQHYTIPLQWQNISHITSYSTSESSIYETSSYELSPTSLNQGRQESIHFRQDSAEPLGTTVQPPDSSNISTLMPRVFRNSNGFDGVMHSPEACYSPGIMNSRYTRRLEPSTRSIENVVRRGHERSDHCEQKNKTLCSYPECTEKFSHKSDLTRHVKTKHSETGNGYRCAFKGCPKAYKVWLRLDSFKKHVKDQHKMEKPADVQGLVKKSCTEHHGLPFSVTTPRMMTRSGLLRPGARSSSSRV